MNVFIFRRDLRIFDNTALNLLSKISNDITPIFIFNPDQIFPDKNPYFSNNAVQFMIQSLKSLEKNIKINYFEGYDIDVLDKLHNKYNITNIAFNIDYTPFARKRDNLIIEWCKKKNINVITAEDYTLFKIGTILNKAGNPFQVFTAFYNTIIKYDVQKPKKNKKIKSKIIINDNNDINKYYVYNKYVTLKGGRKYALMRLKKNYDDYDKLRDYPALDKTTKLSPYIKFGCISIRETYHKFNKGLQRELIWREFYANILYHYPHVLGNSFKLKYNNIKWENNIELFNKWCSGTTGFPIIDAGMRQLNKSGWMHNRIRMIVATFLTKDLLIDWRWGEKYFAKHLVDYDPASNNGGWQWCASTGTDSQPYFRIFNPTTQIQKYDKNYEYIKKWCPEYKLYKPIINHNINTKKALILYKSVI